MTDISLASQTRANPLRHAGWTVILLLAALPFVAAMLGLDYYVSFARRVLIVAIAAMSLDFILGVGGLPSLGHAAFIGVGAYMGVALLEQGATTFWTAAIAAVLAAATAAALIGAVALRTRGTYFIMITLAFAQMLYYFAVSLRSFGGDDGYTLAKRPALGLGLDIDHPMTWYFVVATFAACAFLLLRLFTRARFGHALAGVRDNETRMIAMGYPVYLLKLSAFVIAGAIAGLAGFLTLVDNRFFSPTSMHWTQSALLLVMVVLGGAGRLWGAVLGVLAWMIVEELVRQHTEYWHWPLGLALILVTLYLPRGLMHFAGQRERA